MTPDISAIAKKHANTYAGRDEADPLGLEEHGLAQRIRFAIEEATASLRAQLEQRWIPVSERLPEKSSPTVIHTVLVFAQKWYPEPCLGYLASHGKWRIHNSPSDAPVTHWMPLPAATQVAQEPPLNGKEGK